MGQSVRPWRLSKVIAEWFLGCHGVSQDKGDTLGFANTFRLDFYAELVRFGGHV